MSKQLKPLKEWKAVSIPTPLYEAIEKYVEANNSSMGKTPELKNVPSFVIHILNRELEKLGVSQ
jgi:hypothetical protein